jgi:AMP-binding enzyme
LASALTFDPCLSDILATVKVHGTLAIATRSDVLSRLGFLLEQLAVTHVLCTPTVWSTVPPRRTEHEYSKLCVVALGGEHIPKAMARNWARKSESDQSSGIRLCASFGVTEACVYQTFGEVFWDRENPSSPDVGFPLDGMGVRVCCESMQDDLLDVSNLNGGDGVGEIVLFGNQLDAFSSYLDRPELTACKFLAKNGTVYYRTGDRGYVHPDTNKLHVKGRIEGEDGMVKIHGVRTELGGIESALIDDSEDCSVVLDAIVVTATSEGGANRTELNIDVRAFVVLSQPCLAEMGIGSEVPESGILCSQSPLLTLLFERCKVTKVSVSVFVIIPRIPLSPTGKRSRAGVPSIDFSLPLQDFASAGLQASLSVPLQLCGRAGGFVAKEITDCLNLRPGQAALVTTASTFAMLGGDSLAATRVVRAIYARHHNVVNNRFIGGEYGVLEGPFAVIHLLRAKDLGAYVKWLDDHDVFNSESHSKDPVTELESRQSTNATLLTCADDGTGHEAEHLQCVAASDDVQMYRCGNSAA